MIGNQIKVTETNGKIRVLKPELDTEKFFFGVMNEYREWYNNSDNKPQSLIDLSDLRKEFDRINDDISLIESQYKRLFSYLSDLELDRDILDRAKNLLDEIFIRDEKRGALNKYEFPNNEVESILNEINNSLNEGERFTITEFNRFENYFSNCYQREIDIRKQSAISYVAFIAFRLNSINDKIPAFDEKVLDNLFGKPHNYTGELSKEAVQDLTEFRKEKPNLGINDFFKSAYTRFPSCRYTIKDGEKIKVKWGTIRDRTKEKYPDIYYGNIKAL